MLQTIREHTQGWIAGIIISIIIMTFALWGVHSYFIGGANNTQVASVNGVEISKQQLAVAYERVRRQLQIEYGANHPISSKDELALKKRALQALIEIEVLKQASLAQGFNISNAQVDAYLQSMPDFQVNGQFSIDRFQEVLSSTLLSTEAFLDLIKTGLLIDQPKLGIVFSAFALPDETQEAIALVDQERDIDFISLPLQYFSSKPITIDKKNIEEYYQTHKNAFMTPEQVSVEYVQLGLNDLTSTLTPSDSALKNFYKENANSYLQPVQWKLADILIPVPPKASKEVLAKANEKALAVMKALKAGEDHVKLIKANQSKQIELQGTLPLSKIPADWQKTVSGLTKVGDVSNPIKTNEGFVVVKVLAFVPASKPSFETVKEKVKASYLRQVAEDKFAEVRDQLADATYEHPDSLEYASKKLSLPIKTSVVFSKDKGGKDISQNNKVRQVAFSDEVLKSGNNSDVLLINSNSLVVLRIKTHDAATLLPLDQVSKQIEEQLKKTALEENAAKFAEELKNKLQAGEKADQLASTLKLSWNKVGYIGRYATKVDAAILDLAFRMPPAQGVSYAVTRIPTGYAIVALKAIKPGNADAKKAQVFAEQVQNSEGLLEYELYKQSQINNAKIQMQ